MARIKIGLPGKFSFTTSIPVRITDINYGGHVGNDTILSILHEARARFLSHHGYTELNLAGVGMIMSDVGIEFKNELFYGEEIIASVAAGEFSKVSFELFYKLEKKQPVANCYQLHLPKQEWFVTIIKKRKLALCRKKYKQNLQANGFFISSPYFPVFFGLQHQHIVAVLNLSTGGFAFF
jgi:acyl-CoA thioesterase FadM